MSKKLILFVGALLVMVIAGQGYYLYKMSTRLDALETPDLLSLNGNIRSDIQDNWFNDTFRDSLTHMHAMQKQFNRLFADVFGEIDNNQNFDGLFKQSGPASSLNIIDKGKQYVVKVTIPGADEASINVHVDSDRLLTIQAKTHREQKQAGQGLFNHELQVSQYQQSLALPRIVDPDSMRTEYKDGVLSIYFNKMRS